MFVIGNKDFNKKDEMIKAGCDFEKAAIGIIPLGTGNDFARAMGWGGGMSGDLVGKKL